MLFARLARRAVDGDDAPHRIIHGKRYVNAAVGQAKALARWVATLDDVDWEPNRSGSGDGASATCLVVAAINGHEACVAALLASARVDPNAGSNVESPLLSFQGRLAGGWTPLVAAARGGHARCVKRLVNDPRVDVHAASARAGSALHCAVACGHDECVRELLSCARLDPNDRGTTKRTTPLDLAVGAGNALITRLLLRDARVCVFGTLPPESAEGPLERAAGIGTSPLVVFYLLEATLERRRRARKTPEVDGSNAAWLRGDRPIVTESLVRRARQSPIVRRFLEATDGDYARWRAGRRASVVVVRALVDRGDAVVDLRGLRVVLRGLDGPRNGRAGVCERWNGSQRRWAVALDGARRPVAVRPRHVVVEAPDTAARNAAAFAAFLASPAAGDATLDLVLNFWLEPPRVVLSADDHALQARRPLPWKELLDARL